MSCAICFERFKGSDNNLYSTTCGHIYHFVCMQQWKSRSTSCPQCRSYNPKTHKIYLELNDEEPNSTLLEDQLRECRLKIIQLELELKRVNNNYNNASNAGNTVKCQMLEETLESTLEHNSNLEKRLQEAQIKINELQNRISTMDVNLNNIQVQKNNLELNYANLQIEIEAVNESSNTRLTSFISDMIRNTSLTIFRTLIIPGSNLTNYVLYIGHKMNVHYVRSDIIKTALLNDGNTLLVQFRCAQLREKFYRNQSRLNYHSETKSIQFGELTNEALFNTTFFDYALNLKMFNYKFVFRQNKKVMARRDDDEDPIRIYTREHVEELIEEEVDFDSDSDSSSCSSY